MRRRTFSTSSSTTPSVVGSLTSDYTAGFQELETLYDYLSKIILLGPSGCGKSCILHRFVKGEWKVLTSQTVGVEFASKIVRIGPGGDSVKRMKLQLWDTAGQERFRSLTRGYYRGSAGVLLVYDVTSRESFQALEEFIDDVRALTSPGVSIVVLGNKCDLVDSADPTTLVPESDVARFCMENGSGDRQYKELNTGTNSINFSGGDIAFLTTSALTGENVEEAFRLLAGMILTKIEMGVIDPENIESGVQYGEVPSWDRNSITRRGMSGTSFGSSGGSSKKPPQQHGRSLTTLVAGSGAAPAAPAAAGNGNSGSPADMLSLKKTVSHSAVPDAPFSPKGQSLFSSKFTVQEKNPQQRLITIHDLQDVSPLTSLPANDAGFDPSPQGASSFTDSRRPSYASQFTTSSIGSAGTTNNTPVGGSTEANSIYSSNSACNISSNANNTPASTDSGTRAKVNPISFPQPDDVFDNKEFQRFTQARSQSQTSESSNSNNNYNYSSNSNSNNNNSSNSNNNNSNNNNNLSAKNVRTDSVDSSSVSTKKSKKSFLGKFISRRESSADFNERNKRLKPKNSEANLRTVSNASSFKIDLHNPLSHRPSAGFFTSHRDNNDSPNDRRMSAFPVNNRYSPAAFSPVGLRQRRTLANCLITLSLSDNRLTDECFEEISWLTELQVLNLSYNELVDIPYGALRQLHHLTELYLSGNNLTSLPADDLERIQSLRILHVNSNKLHSLPAELGKIRNLTCLDVGSNNLKYNINNWPYDWNWNYNLNLKYLNFSGNRRLEVKAQHNQSSHFGRDLPDKDLSDFTVLNSVRVLGLMDVTLITQTVPDQTENCRVRAYGSEINSMPYGLADSIGHNENLSVIDMVIERFRGKDNEVVIGLFDGRSDDALGGNKVSKLIQENFGSIFSQELKKLRENETVQDALRRAFLNTNKEIGNTSLLSSQELAHSSLAHRSSTAMSLDYHDGMTGSCATIVYIVENKMYVANSGDSMAIISRGSGEFSVLTTRHDPTAQDELGRIRQGGGVVSSTGQLDDILDVSRALGYYNLIPHIHATPSITEYDLADNDEILIIGSKHLWEYVSYQIALDVVRMSEGDFMRAAAKLRDFAIAYGASDKIMVMIIGVGISRRKSKSRIIGTSFGPMTSIGEEELFPAFKRKRDRSLLPEDSELARLGGEVDPPVNELAMVFTDIKNSTLLWETSPTAMRSAIKIHNSIMRRQLRIIGGYEVKTEGDAFMVSFPTPTSALLWSLSVQSLLLVADWPAEILECLEGGEILDENAEVIFRGLSVRMGIHWGSPVCEKDPITRRMDYFGPMVNRAARVSAVADGGQIALSFDFVAELKKLESAYNRYNSEESVTLAESFAGDEALGLAIEHDLKMLNNQGWVLKELGEEKLKGLENPEFISLAYQKSLLGRYKIHQERLELKRSASTKRYSAQQPSKIPQAYLDLVLQLRHITLRLERVCAKLSTFAMGQVEEEHNQRTSLFLGPGFHFTNEHDYAVMLNNLVTRIENCLSTVYLRATAQSIVMATNASAGDSTDGPITNNEAQLVANLLKLGPGSHGLSDILKALLNV
ncbi:hypothetical protein DV454_000703 [Geotrichum candidum]|nr:hypothetical protein DV454_000703 [Geotrichum candidum]